MMHEYHFLQSGDASVVEVGRVLLLNLTKALGG
jgi:hypothetical protein